MTTTYSVDTVTFVVTFQGDVNYKVPINPQTKLRFQTYNEADIWGKEACAKINTEVVSLVKIWTPYQFMKLLGSLSPAILAGIVSLEQSNDTQTIIAMKMFNVAKDIRSNDPYLINTLAYWVSKGILTEEQKTVILG